MAMVLNDQDLYGDMNVSELISSTKDIKASFGTYYALHLGE
jgi:hypothetical protein